MLETTNMEVSFLDFFLIHCASNRFERTFREESSSETLIIDPQSLSWSSLSSARHSSFWWSCWFFSLPSREFGTSRDSTFFCELRFFLTHRTHTRYSMLHVWYYVLWTSFYHTLEFIMKWIESRLDDPMLLKSSLISPFDIIAQAETQRRTGTGRGGSVQGQ